MKNYFIVGKCNIRCLNVTMVQLFLFIKSSAVQTIVIDAEYAALCTGLFFADRRGLSIT